MRADAPPLKSLDVALEVLEALDGAQELGVSEVARRVGISKAATHRILTTLARRGYVAQNAATAQYAIGPRLRRFSHIAAEGVNVITASRPFMTELRDATGDQVHLATLDGAESVYIAREDGLHPVQVVSRVGARSPAHCVATGKALLAHASPALQHQIAAGDLTRYTPLTHASEADLLAELARIRARGCAINRGEWRSEVRGVAAPVYDSSGRVVAAIGVCSPASRLTDERIDPTCDLVIDTARRLSARLGWNPPAATGTVVIKQEGNT
ncbi:MAG: IclR family transcriptional regulator [Thermomicrobiales bacterium]